jgi:excisionase family DNA binding protein
MAAEVLTTEEAAHYLRTNVGTIKRLAREGRLPGLKIGRGWRFRRADIDEVFVEHVVDRELLRLAEEREAAPDDYDIPFAQVKARLGE